MVRQTAGASVEPIGDLGQADALGDFGAGDRPVRKGLTGKAVQRRGDGAQLLAQAIQILSAGDQFWSRLLGRKKAC